MLRGRDGAVNENHSHLDSHSHLEQKAAAFVIHEIYSYI